MKKITLKPFKVSVRENGFWDGFSLKRDLTIGEALYIADNALGVNITVIKDDWKSRIKEERMTYMNGSPIIPLRIYGYSKIKRISSPSYQ